MNVRYLFTIAKASRKSLLALAIGWIWVALSIALGWKVPSSGAILICFCVIAEGYLFAQPWYHMPYELNRLAKRVGKTSEHPNGGTWLYRQEDVVLKGEAASPCIIATAHNINREKEHSFLEEFAQVSDEGIWREFDLWDFDGAARKVKSFHQRLIVASTLSGSVLWGYGDIIWQS